MRFHRWRIAALMFCAVSATLLALSGCNFSGEDQRERDERTRDEVAKATERAKPQLEEAGRKLGHAAEVAAEEAHAAAQGVRDGWRDGRHPLVDLNSASERDLLDLPGITRIEALRIVAGRPYRDKHDIVSRGILSDSAYQRIRDLTTVK
jgi:DNA uptake protein ComE-like DNA-binding protein